MARPATLTSSEMASMRTSVESFRKQKRWSDMVELQLKMLRSSEQTLGNEHPDTLALMHDLAMTYSNGRQLKNAADMFRPLYEARQRLLGSEHPTTIKTMHYLAVTYTDLGRLNDAEALHKKILPIRKRLLGNDHVDTLRTMQYLAVTCGNLGKLTHARDLYEEMLPIRRRKLGNDHDATILVMNNLAVTYTDLRQFHEAEALHQEVLVIRRRLKGDENHETIKTMHCLAVVCDKMGRLANAVEWHEKVLPLRKRLLGPGNSATLTTMNHLAIAYTDLGRLPEAGEMYSQLMDVRRLRDGVEHTETLRTAYKLSQTYVTLKKWSEAENLLLEILPLFDRVLGKDHAYSMTGLSYIALIYEQSARWTEAERYEKDLLERRKRFNGENHPSILTSMKSLSLIYQSQRRWQEVDSIEESISRLTLDSPGSSSQLTWHTAEVTNALASTSPLSSALQSPSSNYSADTMILSKILGPDQPELIAFLEADAVSSAKQEQWTNAEKAFNTVLLRRRRVQGDGHPFTIQTMSNLVAVYQIQSKHEDAISVFQTALTRLEQNPLTTNEHVRADLENQLSNLRGGAQVLLRPPRLPGVVQRDNRLLITAAVTPEDIMAYLTNTHCPDLTHELEEANCDGPTVSGGFGEVSQGKLRDGRTVALKCLREINGKRFKYLARELYSWSKTLHQNVLELFGVAHFRGNIFMISPWMEYGNLRDYLKQNYGIDRLSIVIQVTEGVAYLHGIPMMHGDIKAANVFVSEHGIAKIGDFGTSTFQTDQSVVFSSTSNPNLAGTIRWMAPEMFEVNSAYSREADVYALGMTILEIFTGKVPFSECDHEVQLIKAVTSGTKPNRPKELTLHPQLWALLNQCWDHIPQKRPTASHILSEVLGLTTRNDHKDDPWTLV